MLAHLTDVSIRSLLLAFLAAIVLWIPAARRTAALQHAVWTAVLCGMLALFTFGPVLPPLPLRILQPDPVASGPSLQTTPLHAISNPSLPGPETPAPSTHAAHAPLRWNALALSIYAAIAFAFLARFATGIFLARRLRTESRPVDNLPASESESVAVPLTIGWLRPRIVLPASWREWDREKLDAVLAHEGAHVRRRDGLVAALAGVNRCIFWFHPLAWILERKLALLAEQACDESCVAVLGDRERYARLLLEMASVVDPFRGRLRSHTLTMASASHIRQRIDSLLADGRTFSRGLSRAGWAAIAFSGAPLVLGAGAVQLERQPVLLRLEIPRWSIQAPDLTTSPIHPTPLLIAQVQSTAAPVFNTTPKFDTASVRSCSAGDGAGRSGRGGGGGGRGFGHDPGRLWVTCLSLRELVDIAYGQFASEPLLNDSTAPNAPERIRGGPAWAVSDYYTIDAHTDNPVANGDTSPRSPANVLMTGPMLRALLEDRFQLKIHRELEEVPMYALTVANSGLKLRPMEEGECVPMERILRWAPGEKPPCGWIGWTAHGPNRTLEGGGVPLHRVSEALGDLFMDRHVIDRTGNTSIFNIHLEYAPDKTTPLRIPLDAIRQTAPAPTSDIPLGAPIFTAVEQQLGLTLESTRGPHAFLAIDSAQRPAEN